MDKMSGESKISYFLRRFEMTFKNKCQSLQHTIRSLRIIFWYGVNRVTLGSGVTELAEKKRPSGKFDLHILEAMLIEVNTFSWIIHSGATNHVCSSLQLLRSFRELAEKELTMHVDNRPTVSVKVIGEDRPQFGARYLYL